MVYNREQAARRAEVTTTNVPGMCQQVTRGYYDAPSAGDQDHDGDFDAYDGWLSEPESARHPGDRNPPRGTPVSFKNRHGHRAISLGDHKIRSTDMDSMGRYSPGRVSTVTIDQIEAAMNVEYLGWSKTIDGIPIPVPPEPMPTLVAKFLEGGPRYNEALLDRAIAHGRTGTVQSVRDEIDRQVHRLRRVEGSPRVDAFLKAHREDRLLRIGLLNKAIKAGRTGTVKDVRAKIMQQIHKLPPR